MYLSKVEHAKVGVHGHGARRLTNLLVDPSSVGEFALHCEHVGEEQLHVGVTMPPTLLVTHTTSNSVYNIT